MYTKRKFGSFLLAATCLGYAAQFLSAPSVSAANGNAQPIKVSSPAFAQGAPIPKQYTADGANISPPISWDKLPPNSKILVLIVEDPDAPRGTWVHWVLYNYPVTEKGIPANLSPDPVLPNNALQGLNSFNKVGYGGPEPPAGKTHHYYFTLYALDAKLQLPGGMRAEQMKKAFNGHILGFGQLVGTYAR